jgi:hypothetical protein
MYKSIEFLARADVFLSVNILEETKKYHKNEEITSWATHLGFA